MLTPCVGSSPNGLDLYGNSGAQEAGTLTYASASSLVTVSEFSWVTDRRDIDQVWPHWHNAVPYNNGSRTPDFFGQVTLRVTNVPEPTLLLLLGAALPAFARLLRRHP